MYYFSSLSFYLLLPRSLVFLLHYPKIAKIIKILNI